MTGCIRKFIANEHEYNFQLAPYGDITQGFDIRKLSVTISGQNIVKILNKI